MLLGVLLLHALIRDGERTFCGGDLSGKLLLSALEVRQTRFEFGQFFFECFVRGAELFWRAFRRLLVFDHETMPARVGEEPHARNRLVLAVGHRQRETATLGTVDHLEQDAVDAGGKAHIVLELAGRDALRRRAAADLREVEPELVVVVRPHRKPGINRLGHRHIAAGIGGEIVVDRLEHAIQSHDALRVGVNLPPGGVEGLGLLESPFVDGPDAGNELCCVGVDVLSRLHAFYRHGVRLKIKEVSVRAPAPSPW